MLQRVTFDQCQIWMPQPKHENISDTITGVEKKEDGANVDGTENKEVEDMTGAKMVDVGGPESEQSDKITKKIDDEIKQVSEFEKDELFDPDSIAALIDKSKEETAETLKKNEKLRAKRLPPRLNSQSPRAILHHSYNQQPKGDISHPHHAHYSRSVQLAQVKAIPPEEFFR